MKKKCASFILCVAGVIFAGSVSAADLTASLEKGTPKIESAGPIAFGPEGILFAADPQGAAIFAIATGDTKAVEKKGELSVGILDPKIAALLGTSQREIEIRDLAVNPISGVAYLSVSRGRGPDAKPVIVRVAPEDKLSVLDLEDVQYAKAELPDAPAPEAVERGNRGSRQESITDLAWVDGRLLVAGLSNEEFASTLRSIPFPFDKLAKGTSVEIYHGAHGRFETRSPVRTFVSFEIAGEPHILAAYTCTPLVKFPVKKLEPGEHLKGTTIAELGNRNRPLDMIVYEKAGKSWLLLANNARGVMKIPTEDFDDADSILTRVEGGARKGVPYETIESWVNIHQLDKLDETHAVVIHRDDEGTFHLSTRELP